ncbi:MAG: TolC family protein [Bacteroides sp.]|nr:TolC family protein [Bacteroides sp.]
MRKFFCFICLAGSVFPTFAQDPLSLDSCRSLAIANNKELLISQEKINAARYQKKAAFTNYLPNISASGGYMRNQKEFSLLSDAHKATLSSVGTQVSTAMQSSIQGILTQYPTLVQDAQLMTLMQVLSSTDIATPLNSLGSSLVDAFRTDTRNIYAGALTLTQPLYMGGKIRAYNKITKYAEELARQQHNTGVQDVILSTDQAYWQVVSLASKKKLAEGYLALLQKLESDVEKMIAEGVATKADGLSVKVKVNEAEMTLTKVNDGVSLARMLLCQLCGLDLSSPITLEDEQKDDLEPALVAANGLDLDQVYNTRPEVRSLELATQIYKQKVNVVRSEYLPSLALIGSYAATNPSVFNGFENKFKGMWSVGVTLSVPIWHWGEGIYKVKAAKAEARIAQFQLDEAKEKIELQVNQSAFKVNEAAKKLVMAEKNLEKANENLRYANLGFEEGVIPASNVLEAHTAWLSAQSERIDAQIDVKLTEIYLKKATGQLTMDN